MSETTSTTVTFQPVSIDVMVRAMQEISLLPKPTEWVLIDPQGNVYKGEFAQVFNVLVAHHPLLRPVTFGQSQENQK